MLNFKKLFDELENAEDKTNGDEEKIRRILEYASYPNKEIDYNFFKDISSELILKAIDEIKKLQNNVESMVLKDMVMIEYIKDNTKNFIPKANFDDDLFF